MVLQFCLTRTEMPSISRGASAEDMEFVFCVFDGYVTVNDNNTATLM